MMALQILLLLQLIVIFRATEILAGRIPVYGTKRYGRVPLEETKYNNYYSGEAYDPYSNYYNSYPQNYYTPRSYYPQSYYETPRTSFTPEIAYYPYYPSQEYGSYYDNPQTHDTYENLNEDNSEFVKNFLLSEASQPSSNDDNEYFPVYDDDYEKLDDLIPISTTAPEDEPERELMKLRQGDSLCGSGCQRKQKAPKTRTVKYLHEPMLYPERKPVKRMIFTTTPPSNTMGQKEQFEIRPATPVRHAFATSVLTMPKNDEKRVPSVYDTIKQILDMEKSFDYDVAIL